MIFTVQHLEILTLWNHWGKICEALVLNAHMPHVSCFFGLCVSSLFACNCVCCVVCVVCVKCVSWVLSPASQPCDLWVQMRRPIDHKIGVPFWLWQLNCKAADLSLLALPCSFFFFFFVLPLSASAHRLPSQLVWMRATLLEPINVVCC